MQEDDMDDIKQCFNCHRIIRCNDRREYIDTSWLEERCMNKENNLCCIRCAHKTYRCFMLRCKRCNVLYDPTRRHGSEYCSSCEEHIFPKMEQVGYCLDMDDPCPDLRG